MNDIEQLAAIRMRALLYIFFGPVMYILFRLWWWSFCKTTESYVQFIGAASRLAAA